MKTIITAWKATQSGMSLNVPILNFFALIIFWIGLNASEVYGQETYLVKGKVIDAETGEGIPVGNVYPKSNTALGTTTDFDGYFTLKLTDISDSIVASYIGYTTKVKAIDPSKVDENNVIILNFQLKSETRELQEFVFVAGEDPSYPIMRKVLKNKKLNDKRSLGAYDYESYVKIELDVDHVTERFGRRKIIQKVQQAIDSAGGLTGEDGYALIPLFLSETISRVYYQSDPERTKEKIIKTKIEGVGLGDNSPISQIIGASYQEYNFYKNWMKILEKSFVSPLSDGWKLYYDYYLADSVYIGEHFCYKIEIYPKNPQDLAFEGNIWIDKATYALKQIDVKIGKEANVNFVEKIKIQQEYNPTPNGPWIPGKTRVLIDVAELTEKSAGVLVKFYISQKDFAFDKKFPLKFFNETVEIAPDAYIKSEDYWAQNRHDSLSPAEIKTYALIDTIKQVPIVKTYAEIATVLSTGYKQIGPIDFGNYAYTYAFNNVEGHRFRLGLRTNTRVSNKFEIKGFAAYGTKDRRFKYWARFRLIPDRKRWTELAFERKDDLFLVAANPDDVEVPAIYLAFLNFFNVTDRGPFYRQENNAYIQRDIFKGVRLTTSLKNSQYKQIGNFFAFNDSENVDALPLRDFTTTELVIETRLSKDERFFYTGNNRISTGTRKLPILTFRYTLGLNDFMGGDFNYQKYSLSLEQSLPLGPFGNTYYLISSQYIPSTLPYPILKNHLANESFFYNFYGFNLMDYLEFISDRYVALNLEHNFNGLIANRIPLLKKLKLRTVLFANVLYGSLRDANRDLIPEFATDGTPLFQPNGLGNKPYIEIGYGFSNILKFFQINAMHRITYLNNSNNPNRVRRFGIFVSTRFTL